MQETEQSRLETEMREQGSNSDNRKEEMKSQWKQGQVTWGESTGIYFVLTGWSQESQGKTETGLGKGCGE